ncbi:alpha/beta fold hydrolase [Nonomuraea sp. NPDC049725]|uniref:thioesterase II family protein n=1 Tax=Nonomuraea sp. NPDC049725 TaxID=3154508 RepID=UPI00343B9599
MPGSPWLVPIAARDDAPARLFCLPYAGGSAAGFRAWSSLAARLDLDIQAVELPGHGRRIGEPPVLDPDEMARVVGAAVDRPYLVFGHSLGARLGFELCRRLRVRGHGEPERLFVSGTPGPRLPRVGRGDSRLPEPEFAARVSGMGGTPAAILADPELRALFLPVIRADFALGDAYEYVGDAPLNCPITAFAGSADPEASPEQVGAWRAETTGDFRLHVVDGDHFFVHTRLDTLLGLLADDLAAVTEPGAQIGQPP